MKEFRKLTTGHSESLSNNYRSVNPLNGRIVKELNVVAHCKNQRNIKIGLEMNISNYKPTHKITDVIPGTKFPKNKKHKKPRHGKHRPRPGAEKTHATKNCDPDLPVTPTQPETSSDDYDENRGLIPTPPLPSTPVIGTRMKIKDYIPDPEDMNNDIIPET